MIERNFYNDEFENLLREKTDQYKMYPSDQVWRAVYSTLHTRRKRFIIGMSVLISSILIFAGKELLAPSKQISAIKRISVILPDSKAADAKSAVQPNPILAYSGLKKENLQEAADPYSEYKPGLKRIIESDEWTNVQTETIPTPSANYNAIEVNAVFTNSIFPPGYNQKTGSNAAILDHLPIAKNAAGLQPTISADGLI